MNKNLSQRRNLDNGAFRTLTCLTSVAALLLCGATTHLMAQASVDSVVTSNLFEPYAVATVSDGSFFVSDGANHRIIKVANGSVSGTLLAGQTGVPGTNDGFANVARFNIPQGMVLARGGLVVADSANHTLRFVSLSGAVSNLAGAAGIYGFANGPAFAARFRYPLGLAADAAGNIYIADSQNNAIRKLDTNNDVTTVATGFFQPAGMAIGDNGDLWVMDTRRHCIKVVSTNGTVSLVAGIPGAAGQDDSLLATNAQFSSPRAALWVTGSGLLVSDSGNHTIRRIYWNTNFNTYSVETFAGVPGVPGADNGPALAARFNSPVGLAFDQFSGGFLVVDKGNNQVRRINTGVVQDPVRNPQIGYVDFVTCGIVLRPFVSAVFNNDAIIAILGEPGTATYYTFGDTPANPLLDTIPEPAAGVGLTPPYFEDCDPYSTVPLTIVAPGPDQTIKAIGTLSGRRSSAVVRARLQYQVGNPGVVGDNAASFQVVNVTTNAEMWYTWDGSDPTNNPTANTNVFGPVLNGDFISFNLGDTNRTFKIRGFRNGYKPSDVTTKEFFPTDFVANEISFGFASGEASSDFVGAAGQRFYAPVTLSLLPLQKMYSLQFNVVATNETGTAIDATTLGFESMLQKPTAIPNVYLKIPPAMGIPGNNISNLLIPNYSVNLLEVGWLERAGQTNLYNTLQHDLIKYSQAHDTLFDSAAGRVIVGGFSFVIPITAPQGSTYKVQLGRASATSDGVNRDVYIRIPTNGAPAGGTINGTKTITVGSRLYIVGDCAPFRWFNAGDFGEGHLLNNDVLQVYQSAIYSLNYPPPGSDFFDVMDSSDGTVNNLFTGSIDAIQFGDGALNIDDVYVTYRRSLDPTLKWFARYWSNGILQAIEVPNVAGKSGKLPGGKKPVVSPKSLTNGIPTVVISTDDILGAPGATVQVPIRARISGGLPIRVAMLGVTVQPLEGAPAISQAVALTPAPGLGTPAMTGSRGLASISATWLNDTVAGISGDTVLGTLSITIPASAGSTAAYRIHFDHISVSENGIALFRKHVYDGLVTLSDRSGSSVGDGISDAWRLRYFGTTADVRSTLSADPDGDGVSNGLEFRTGTNPLDFSSSLRLRFAQVGGSAVNLRFSTGTGRTYVVECAPALNGPWSSISTNTGDGATREFTHSAPGDRFYRVRVE